MLLRGLSVPIDDNDSDHLCHDGQRCDSIGEESTPVDGMVDSVQGNGIRQGSDIHRGIPLH